MTDRPLYAPGCYGSVFGYSEDATCGECEFSSNCRVAHFAALSQLQDLYGVKAPTRRKVGLPVKVKKVFDALGKSEAEVREAMLSGRNPYGPKEGTVGLVAQAILHTGGVARKQLAAMISAMCGYNEETSAVYARYAIQIFEHCDAITIDGDTIRPNRF